MDLQNSFTPPPSELPQESIAGSVISPNSEYFPMLQTTTLRPAEFPTLVNMIGHSTQPPPLVVLTKSPDQHNYRKMSPHVNRNNQDLTKLSEFLSNLGNAQNKPIAFGPMVEAGNSNPMDPNIGSRPFVIGDLENQNLPMAS